ncbi:barrier-to-autointegration factor [Octopus vulgaris]|uniref:Barrier-to-autointegration factor n=1 Tax=Octopus vulgaris TaxID=6645 RepID=A0AA36B9L2_OCTVU|nr:barrier-to-autointegration factor [Octopus vulgaris]
MAFSQSSKRSASEPIGNKSVKHLDGVTKALAKKLTEKGYIKAYTVLGQFLVLNKDEKLFKDWLTSSIHASQEQSEQCYNWLKMHCDHCL